MAHFAQLDSNNVVTQVIVVGNDDTSDSNGVEVESIGVAFCQKLLGADTNWKQTCLLYTSPSPRDKRQSRMPSSA